MFAFDQDQLNAFVAAAEEGQFSRAATQVHITQSALTQRIQQLEESLNTRLFVRKSRGVSLTETGEQLLAFCKQRSEAESAFRKNFLGGEPASLSGFVKIAGFSTVMRSIAIPAMTQLAETHANLQFQFFTEEIRDLDGFLLSGKADFVLTLAPITKKGVKNLLLGYEQNVWVRPKGSRKKHLKFLDHDPSDETTKDFWQLQSESPDLDFHYFDDIYGIIDGIAHGFGQAIAPRHLVRSRKDIEIKRTNRELELPVYLNIFDFPVMNPVRTQVLHALESEFRKTLKQDITVSD